MLVNENRFWCVRKNDCSMRQIFLNRSVVVAQIEEWKSQGHKPVGFTEVEPFTCKKDNCITIVGYGKVHWVEIQTK